MIWSLEKGLRRRRKKKKKKKKEDVQGQYDIKRGCVMAQTAHESVDNLGENIVERFA